MKKGEWTFLTNHGIVLGYIAKHRRATAQKIAQEAGLSIRGVQSIITDLEKAGYIDRKKEGRRKHYTTHPELPMRHRLQRGYSVGNLLQAIGFNHKKTVVEHSSRAVSEYKNLDTVAK